MSDNLEWKSRMSKITKSIFEAEKRSILVQMREPSDMLCLEEAINNETNMSANEA